MGLTIHYKGTLTDKRAIGRFIDEVEDIAKAMQWPYRVRDEDWSLPPSIEIDHSQPGMIALRGDAALKGISFQPHPSSEWVSLFFNASCLLTSPLAVALSAEDGYPAELDWLSVKTQFAGAEAHAAIIRLLRYLKGKYLHDLEVMDEGGYWQNGDFAALEQKINFLDRTINQLGQALERLDAGPGDIVERIEQVLRDLHRKQREEGDTPPEPGR